MAEHTNANRVWSGPIVMGIVSLAGLILALLADGWFDWLSVALLLCPAAYGLWRSTLPQNR